VRRGARGVEALLQTDPLQAARAEAASAGEEQHRDGEWRPRGPRRAYAEGKSGAGEGTGGRTAVADAGAGKGGRESRCLCRRGGDMRSALDASAGEEGGAPGRRPRRPDRRLRLLTAPPLRSR